MSRSKILVNMSCELKHNILHYVSQVEVWPLTGSLQHPDSFLLQTFCCRSAAVFGIIVLLMTQLQPSFSCHTDGLTFDSRILWYTEEFMVEFIATMNSSVYIIFLETNVRPSIRQHPSDVGRVVMRHHFMCCFSCKL